MINPHQNLVITIPEDVTVGAGDGKCTIYNTSIYPTSFSKPLNVSSPLRKWHNKVKMWFTCFIFLCFSKRFKNWLTHIISYLLPIYNICTLFWLFLFHWTRWYYVQTKVNGEKKRWVGAVFLFSDSKHIRTTTKGKTPRTHLHPQIKKLSN